MRRFVLAVLAAGCAHAVPERPAPPGLASAAPGPGRPVLVAAPENQGARLEAMLARSGLSYVTVEPGRIWMIGFAREDRPPVMVHVVRGDAYTLIMGRLGTVPGGAGPDFYRGLARRNFDVPQLKLGVDAHDGLYASFEVPSRLVDREELLEDVFGLARTVDELRKALFDGAAPSQDGPLPRPQLPPAAPSPPDAIIEARR